MELYEFDTKYLRLGLNYIQVIINEWISYWFVYLLLSLPPRFFISKTNVLRFYKDEEFLDIRFEQIKLLTKVSNNNYKSECISQYQLALLASPEGYIPINNLLKYYPHLDTLYLAYTREDDDNKEYENINDTTIVKIIDINKRIDIRNATKCKFGRIEL